MSDEGDFSVSALQRKRAEAPANPAAPVAPATPAPVAGSPAAAAGAPPAAGGLVLPVDPLRLLLALWRGKWWFPLAALVFAGPALAFGWFKFETTYTATVQLMRRELSNSFRALDIGEAFKPRQLTVASIVSIMRSPSLLAKVGAQAKPRQSASGLQGSLVITPEKNTDLITVSLQGRTSREATANLLNLYAQSVVDLTKTLQQQEAAELDKFLRDQLNHADTELAAVNLEMTTFSKESQFYSADKQVEAYLREAGDADARIRAAKLELETVGFRIAGIERELARQNPVLLKLNEGRDQLKALRVRFTDANPLVIEQIAKVAALEAEAATATNSVADFQPGNNTVANAMFVDLVSLKAQREALQKQVAPLEDRIKEVAAKLDALPEKGLHYARLKARQESLQTSRALMAGRQREAQLFADNSLGYYRLFAPTVPEDVAESSKTKKMLVLTVAGLLLGLGLTFVLLCAREAMDVRVISPADMRRATGAPVLARLADLNTGDEETLARWRFATWSALFRALGQPAERTLITGVVSATPGEGRSTWIRLLEAAAAERDLRTLVVTNLPPVGTPQIVFPLADALADPALVTRAIEAQGRVALECPLDWTWSTAVRAQWTAALRHWLPLPRLALLVELPPAERLDTVLVAETLPQVLWVCRSGVNEQEDIARNVKTLRASDAQLRGVLANLLPAVFGKLPDLSRFGLVLTLGLGLTSAVGAPPPDDTQAPPLTNAFLSASAQGPKLAPWQQRLTLGPNDVVNLSIFGRKEFTRNDVPIGPDGCISYLQAQGVPAAGLTLDELRAKLTEELRQHYHNAQVIVTPAAFRSKRYFLLGTVIDRGAFTLDRPTTIIEAIARARGIATGLLEQNTVEIADLPRAFLIRGGKPLPVDFVRLFQQGDLTQNLALEPDDYIYFPSAALNEIYVLGAVASPGTVGVTDRSSLIGILTTRGGFTEKAYRQRVLVVRGSLTKPETFVINAADILTAKAPDFMLKPKDIVFVADRPWWRAEDLLDAAISSYISAVATSSANKALPTRTR